MPLAIELAAARVRALSLRQIADSLNDRFRLLTGGARNVLRRQQTLRASVDWSHALLTDAERTLFRRLGVFMGGFDLEAAQAVAAITEAEQFQILDQLSLLVDKSLVIADDESGVMRFRLLETMRQYALEKLSESGEADEVRDRHRDHYVGGRSRARARRCDWSSGPNAEIDNIRAAHTWSVDKADFETALGFVSSLQRLWVNRGRFLEGIAAFDAVFTDGRYRDADVAARVWVRAVSADKDILAAWIGVPASLERAEEVLAAARELGDQDLVDLGPRRVRRHELLQSRIGTALLHGGGRAWPRWWTTCRCSVTFAAIRPFPPTSPGSRLTSRLAAEEGRDIADTIGDRFMSRFCRIWQGMALVAEGDIAKGRDVLTSLLEETQAANERMLTLIGHRGSCVPRMPSQGDVSAAAEIARSTHATVDGAWAGSMRTLFYRFPPSPPCSPDDCRRCQRGRRGLDAMQPFRYESCLYEALTRDARGIDGTGDVVGARRWVDENLAVRAGMVPHATRSSRVRISRSHKVSLNRPSDDAHEALAIAQRDTAHTCRFQMRSTAWPACRQMQVTIDSPLACSARRQAARERIGIIRIPALSRRI